MPIYMKITKNGMPVIKGDASAKGREKWIELSSAQMGQSRIVTNTSTSEAPASSISEIVITKMMDSATTALFRQSMNGEGVTIQIDFVKPGGKKGAPPSTYLSITLHDALISNYQIVNRFSRATETLTLNFAKMTFDLHDAGPDVSDHATGRMMGWDSRPGAP
jgi:type VI secretion system secreted protein Hcp